MGQVASGYFTIYIITYFDAKEKLNCQEAIFQVELTYENFSD